MQDNTKRNYISLVLGSKHNIKTSNRPYKNNRQLLSRRGFLKGPFFNAIKSPLKGFILIIGLYPYKYTTGLIKSIFEAIQARYNAIHPDHIKRYNTPLLITHTNEIILTELYFFLLSLLQPVRICFRN